MRSSWICFTAISIFTMKYLSKHYHFSYLRPLFNPLYEHKSLWICWLWAMGIFHASFYQDSEVYFLLKNIKLEFRHSVHKIASSILSNYAVNVSSYRRINYFQILGHSNVILCNTLTWVKVLREIKHNAIFARLYAFEKKIEILFKIMKRLLSIVLSIAIY